MIPYGRQLIDDDDVEAVVNVLRGEWLTTGPHIDEFEENLAGTVGARYAVTFANGTAALHGAVAAGRLGPGDVGATSALTFAASGHCFLYLGARVELVDIDPRTFNLSIDGVPPVDGLVAVHFAGLPCDLSALKTRPRIVIEDASHALGARGPDGPVGNCARSDMTVFSFHPVKHVTTAEGGAVTTNSEELAERLRTFRNHGIVRKPDQGGWYYEIDEPGFNYRLTDIQAALGTSQMRKLERFVERRNQLAERYRALLADLPVGLPPAAAPGWRHAYHLFPVQVPRRREVYDALRQAGIGVQVHYVPMYRHAAFRTDPARFPETEKVYSRLLSLPLFPALEDQEQDRVVEALAAALSTDS